ncbi:aminotransferase-like domain-containing protein [Spirosoma rhododendri]|uniref:PLP-dependent aminotransferase family protein n=1 Tax=Spirosoma rhododendri TaxID=2728024 RepID=A0A7L5DVP0_9BACT|nr:PLP-dependent aminotransferase family protein [Spirosoma rhododendri]QJD79610.1 PLP-dependent aminotransferase family protein [Spirosoma rhododendri]
MLPYKSLIRLDKTLPTPIFVQLSEQLRQLIRTGTLSAGQRLPGTRQLAGLLDLHRQTVVAAYDEGLAQGWLESRSGSGTYVAAHSPDVWPRPLPDSAEQGVEEPIDQQQIDSLARPGLSAHGLVWPGYAFAAGAHLTRPVLTNTGGLRLDDGFPDARLAPMDELSRAYRSYFRWGDPQQHFGYGDTKGHPLLREQLAQHLAETRGLRITPDNVLITRGSIMGLHLSCQVLLRPGDVFVMGESSWAGAAMNARQAGATVLTVPADQHGLDVTALAQLCEQRPVRMVYVTPHHHYPTTVTLRADRRVRLLQLAERWGFAIVEDDYDYDFHYLSRPILPLASADRRGMVVYVGSLTKSIAPAFRVGYVVAPTALIDELARLRRIIDRQGDTMLEFAIGQLLRNGDLKRHFRKALRTYHARRDQFCDLLTDQLADAVQFSKPDGGLAVWATFREDIDLVGVAERAGKLGLTLANGLSHDLPDRRFNSTRLGFASSTEAELAQSVLLLKKALY